MMTAENPKERRAKGANPRTRPDAQKGVPLMKPVIVLNPKAASTSLRSAVPHVKVPDLKHYRTIHQPLSGAFIQTQLRQSGGKAFVFGCVRHPLDRFVSAFYYFKAPHKRNVQENWVLESLCENMSINEFARFANLAKLSKHVPHFRRQRWFFAPGKNERRADLIIYFESIGEGYRELGKQLDIRLPRLPVKRATVHGQWRDELTEDNARALAEFYKPDFIEFGYEWEW